ncbi:serine protease [Thioalkalivibrio paradoxus ARh 1]|uniref:Serine protease n=1 Tax=Thioalkalivibrio paradoxus ARh 1 TaxID=713585 RepID=W0DJ74_9GAMM|nr:serine protease [Thioalkalivibrio paradoxus ARh 1]
MIQSLPLIGMPAAYAAGGTGTGQVVAVLDTGARLTHEHLSTRIVEGACYNRVGSWVPSTSRCPGGAGSATTLESGDDCTSSTWLGCGHGTHLASTAAGFVANPGSGVPPHGVAPDARIMSTNVFSLFHQDTGYCGRLPGGYTHCLLTWQSDQIAALERVYARRTARAFAAVNMSLGDGQYFSACTADPRRWIVQELTNVGIAVVASAGNDGSNYSIRAPACIPEVIAVGSTTKSDERSSFSNWGSLVDIAAPGSSINAAFISGTSNSHYAHLSGTSMAAPHVAGAFASVRAAYPTATIIQIRNALRDTGTAISSAGSTIPRINVDAAIDSLSASACPYDDHLTLQNTSVTSPAFYGACRTITAGPAFVVTATGDATFRAGQRISLRPGFAVRAGGRFRAEIEPGLASHPEASGQSSIRVNPTDGSVAGLAQASEQDRAGTGTLSRISVGSGRWWAPTVGYAPEREGPETTRASEPAGTLDGGTANSPEHDGPTPRGLTAMPGDGSVALRWETVSEADGYHVYWSQDPGIHPFTAASYEGFLGNVPDARAIVADLENDREYVFVVTATRGGRESAASIEVAAIPEAGPVLVAGRYRLDALDAPTVVDLDTGLEWRRCALGQQWDGAACTGSAGTYSHAEAQQATAAFNRSRASEEPAWRLPEIGELRGLVYCTSGTPAHFPDGTGCWGSHGIPTLEPTVFPTSSTAGGWFWSRSIHTDGQAWGVDFNRGQALSYQMSAGSGVRLVRPLSMLPPSPIATPEERGE